MRGVGAAAHVRDLRHHRDQLDLFGETFLQPGDGLVPFSVTLLVTPRPRSVSSAPWLWWARRTPPGPTSPPPGQLFGLADGAVGAVGEAPDVLLARAIASLEAPVEPARSAADATPLLAVALARDPLGRPAHDLAQGGVEFGLIRLRGAGRWGRTSPPR